MDPSVTPFTGKYNEDVVKFSYLGKPLALEHHARHPRPKDPTVEHLRDYVDMVDDHHYDIPVTIKYALKGAFIGTVYGLALGTILKKMNSLATRKMSFFMRENTFGRLEVMREFLIPYALGGAAAGAGFYLFYHGFWTRNSSWSSMWDQTVGYGIYGAALSSCLLHPGLWWVGLWGGATVGFVANHIVYGNIFSNRGTQGFSIELPGLSEEERDLQKARDYIQALGMNEPIARKSIIDL